jgi:hypothetical protein
MANNVIVSCGVGGWYPRGLDRLGSTLQKFSGFDVKLFKNYPEHCPDHHIQPYAFKAYTMQWAANQGYENALWLDAAVMANKDPNVLFDIINEKGYLILLNGWNQANWSTDAQLAYFGYTRDEAEKMPHPMACVFGISFKHDIGKEFLKLYKQAADDGIFKGSWTNTYGEVSKDMRVLGSRHDQTCIGFIAQKLKLEYTTNIVAYRGDLDQSSGFVFHSQGMS